MVAAVSSCDARCKLVLKTGFDEELLRVEAELRTNPNPQKIFLPRGSIYTTIMELGPKRPSPSWLWGLNSIIVVYMDPLGCTTCTLVQSGQTEEWDFDQKPLVSLNL